MLNQDIPEWQTAAMLWPEAMKDNKNNKRFKQPVLLRFKKDSFMDQLMDLLKKDSSKLKKYVLQPENHKKEQSGWLAEEEREKERKNWLAEGNEEYIPKLYQPAHGRYYLVAANLTCRLPGLPDKTILTEKQDKVSFVLRKWKFSDKKSNTFSKDNKIQEYGWITSTKTWKPISAQKKLADEECFPLIPVNHKLTNRQRRLLVGLIPVTGRETAQSGVITDPTQAEPENNESVLDRQLGTFEASVVNGMKGLRETLENSINVLDSQLAQEIMLICLYDFVEFVEKHLQNNWLALNWLKSRYFYSGSIQINWLDALKKVSTRKTDIITGKIKGLGFIFPPSIINGNDYLTIINDAIKNLDILISDQSINDSKKRYKFDSQFYNELRSQIEVYGPEKPELDGYESIPANSTFKNDDIYVIRCIYERPGCQMVRTPVLSEASQPFYLASFFDPEAPTRPIRISMPIDTSISGFRKFKKGVSVLISKSLRNQMSRFKGINMKNLDEGKLSPKTDFDLGMICSFSIPIITICALILLMIMVQILNIVFWWLPFFRICFPKK